METDNPERNFPGVVRVAPDVLIRDRRDLAEVLDRRIDYLTTGQQRHMAGNLYKALIDLLSGKRSRNLVDARTGATGNDRITHLFYGRVSRGVVRVALGYMPPTDNEEPGVEIIDLGVVETPAFHDRIRIVRASNKGELARLRKYSSKKIFRKRLN